MDGEGWARRCGGDREEAIVRRAHQFRSRTRRLKTSGDAGRTTASYLDPHSGDGWFVLHDVAVPGGAASIDHLVVAPAGVFVVESLEWSAQMSQARGALRIGPHLERRDVDALRTAVRAVSDVLLSVLPDLAVVPQGVISLSGCPSADESWRASGMTVVPASRLVRHVSTGPHPYDAERVEQLAIALDEGLVSSSGRSSSLVQPLPLASPDPPGSSISDPASTSPGPDAPLIAAGRPAGLAGSEWRAGGGTLQNVLRPLVAVLGVVLFFYCFAMWGRALPRVTTGISGTSSAGVSPTGASASLRSSWSCPTGGRGWTVNLPWPAAASGGAWMAEVSASPYGPWTIKERAQASRELTLTGLPPGSHRWVRAATSYELLISDPIINGQVVAPDGC
jgi:hypothetical protein